METITSHLLLMKGGKGPIKYEVTLPNEVVNSTVKPASNNLLTTNQTHLNQSILPDLLGYQLTCKQKNPMVIQLNMFLRIKYTSLG